MKLTLIATILIFCCSIAISDSLYPIEKGANAATFTFFNDNRARKVGDPLTVIISENATGALTASSKVEVSRNELGGYEGPASDIAKAFGLDGTDHSNGSGETNRTDALTATISVRVVSVSQTGIMKIVGTKSVQNNGQQMQLRLEGYIRQQDINPDNTIASKLVANADIIYSGMTIQRRRLLFGIFPI